MSVVEVIDYVVRKYGKDRVVQIVTFGTMAARGVIRDVGRVMDLPYNFVDSIAKMVPQELNITLEKALKMNPELRKSYENDPQVQELIDMSMRLEGLPRHTSMHAAGVVISQKSVDEYVPLSRASERFHHHSVCHDYPGRAGPSENGFSGPAYPDGHSGLPPVWRPSEPDRR